MKKYISFSFIVSIVIVSVFGMTSNHETARAAGNEGRTYTLLEPLPCIPYTKYFTDSTGKTTSQAVTCTAGEQIKQIDLGNFFQYAFNLLIGLAAVLAVFMIVWSGFEYATSDAWGDKNEAKDKLWNAVKGLLMILVSFIILKAVNPSLVALPKAIPAINVPKSQLESPAALYDRLKAEAAAFHANIDNVKANIENDQNLINNIDTELQNLDKRISDVNNTLLSPEELCRAQISTDDPSIDAMCMERARLTAEREVLSNDIKLQMVKGISESIDYQCSSEGDPAICLTKKADIATAYNIYASRLNPEQRDEAYDHLLFSQANMEITRQVAIINQKKRLNMPGYGGLFTTAQEMNLRTADANAAYKAIDEAINVYKNQNPNNDDRLLSRLMENKAIANAKIADIIK